MSTAWDGPRRTVNAHGLFEPLRVYRYDIGHHFGRHTDQSYARGDARSLMTLLIYLNDDVDGGETEFPEEHQSITSCTGDALCSSTRSCTPAGR